MKANAVASQKCLCLAAGILAGALLVLVACSSHGSSPVVSGQQVFATIDKAVNVYPGPSGGGSGTATATFPFPAANADLHRTAFDSAGNLYISDHGLNNIYVLPSSTYLSGGTGSSTPNLTISGTGLDKPSGMAFDSKGYLYVADMGGFVAIFAPIAIPSTPAGSPVTPAPYAVLSGAATTLDEPNGLAVDASGNVYVADEGGKDVLIFAASDIASAVAAAVGASPALNIAPSTTITGFGGVHSLTLDASGNLYVTDNGSGNPPYRVDIFSKAQVATKQGSVASAASVYIPGQSASGSVTTMGYPNGIAVDHSGNIYVGDVDNNKVLVFPAVTLGSTTGVEDNVAPIATISTGGTLHDVAVH